MRQALMLLALVISAAAAGEKPVLILLDFSCEGDDAFGKKVARTFRLKLERDDAFTMPDFFEVGEIVEQERFKPDFEDPKAIAAFAKDKLKADIVIWGDCWRDGETVTVKLRAMNLRKGVAAPFLDETYACKGYPAVSKHARDLTRRLTDAGPKEPFASPPEGIVGENLIRNGTFEKGRTSPDAWDKADGLLSFWHREPDGNRCIRMDTDVYEKQALAWIEKFKAGAPAAQAPRKTPTRGPKYNTMAGTYGVKLYSDYIPVKPGAAYRISVDAKGSMQGMFFPKVFVKAYGPPAADRFGKQERELYRCYLACRVQGMDRWQHFSRVFHPTKLTPTARKMRVMIFAYWPPGEYYFDNVRIYEEKP